MKVFHQLGFRYNWNIDSFEKGIGDGLIFSPINIDSDKLLGYKPNLKNTSFLDPQLYLLNVAKGTLDTYPYFPGNIKPDFSTPDLDNDHIKLARLCVDYQLSNNFECLIIPTRYYEDNPTSFFWQSTEHFIDPFCDLVDKNKVNKKILLSVIVKQIMLTDETKQNEVLNWITSHQNIDGVYLIFENNFTSKQIKDFDFLFQALQFTSILKRNQLEVHIGYCNTEALLYSIAMPDSITIGSYENLRSFKIARFQNNDGGGRAPMARLYSTLLLQWIEYTYIDAMKKLIPNYVDYFDNSEYKPLMFNLGDFKDDYKWHFAKPEPYKHYFEVFFKQIKNLPLNQDERIDSVKRYIIDAINNYKEIKSTILLDGDSDDSHLSTWFNVILAFEKSLKN